MNWEKIIKEKSVEALEGHGECEWPQCKNDADWICHKCNLGMCESHYTLQTDRGSYAFTFHDWVNKHNPTKKPYPRKKK